MAARRRARSSIAGSITIAVSSVVASPRIAYHPNERIARFSESAALREREGIAVMESAKSERPRRVLRPFNAVRPCSGRDAAR